MEAVSLIASIITIAGLAVEGVKLANNIYHASEELAALQVCPPLQSLRPSIPGSVL